MKSDLFGSANIESCLAQKHKFTTARSDKTPMKVNLICRTCTERTPGKTVYVAYGSDVGSWGAWKNTRRREKQPEFTQEPD